MNFLKNRTVIGVICILLALIICFAVTPLFNKTISEKTEIVRVVKPVKIGEVCTAFSYVVMFVLFFFLRLPLSLVNALIVCCGVLMAVTWVLYVPVFVKMWKEKGQAY